MFVLYNSATAMMDFYMKVCCSVHALYCHSSNLFLAWDTLYLISSNKRDFWEVWQSGKGQKKL